MASSKGHPTARKCNLPSGTPCGISTGAPNSGSIGLVSIALFAHRLSRSLATGVPEFELGGNEANTTSLIFRAGKMREPRSHPRHLRSLTLIRYATLASELDFCGVDDVLRGVEPSCHETWVSPIRNGFPIDIDPGIPAWRSPVSPSDGETATLGRLPVRAPLMTLAVGDSRGRGPTERITLVRHSRT